MNLLVDNPISLQDSRLQMKFNTNIFIHYYSMHRLSNKMVSVFVLHNSTSLS